MPGPRKSGVLRALARSLLPPAAGAQADWTPVRTEDDGVSVESRAVTGSDMPELRLTLQTPSSPARLMAAAWELRDDGMQARYLERRTVLSQGEDERRLFLALRPPLISPRQCLLQQTRWTDAATGVLHLSFHALPFTPDSDDALPFAHLRGEWRFEPSGATAARVVYTTLVDLGRVPAIVARGPQLEAALATVREVVACAAAP
jgi:hypothetical protein